MCTVTYLPNKNDGYFLTSNRDELRNRPTAVKPEIFDVRGQKILFPKDLKGGGTWIAVSEENICHCILNGADQPHIPGGSYRLSRGVVLLEAFAFNDLHAFGRSFDLSEIEPFTLIKAGLHSLQKLTWDGAAVMVFDLDPKKNYIWASATLYGEAQVRNRENWFGEWHKNINEPLNKIRDFHKSAGVGDIENDLVMERDNGLQTLSITSVDAESKQKPDMIYENLITGEIHLSSF